MSAFLNEKTIKNLEERGYEVKTHVDKEIVEIIDFNGFPFISLKLMEDGIIITDYKKTYAVQGIKNVIFTEDNKFDAIIINGVYGPISCPCEVPLRFDLCA